MSISTPHRPAIAGAHSNKILIVMDVQRSATEAIFIRKAIPDLSPKEAKDVEAALARPVKSIIGFLEKARTVNLLAPMCFVVFADRPFLGHGLAAFDAALEINNNPHFDFHPALRALIQSHDILVAKPAESLFSNPDVEGSFRSNGFDAHIYLGLFGPECILHSALDSKKAGYAPKLVEYLAVNNPLGRDGQEEYFRQIMLKAGIPRLTQPDALKEIVSGAEQAASPFVLAAG